MDKKIIIGVSVLAIIVIGSLLLILQGGKVEPPVERKEVSTVEAIDIAREWIENESPTFTYDGFGLYLAERREIVKDLTYYFVFEFQSRNTGYGDRSGQDVEPEITEHQMKIVVDNGKVLEAVTDGVFSEIEGKMIEGAKKDKITDELSIVVYFGINDYEEELFPVERLAEEDLTIEGALLHLISGPNEEEREEGYFSSINEETRILSLTVEDGTAYVDFSSHLEEGVAGSAMVTFIRNQIEETLMQFPTVDEVVISIEGAEEDILQP